MRETCRGFEASDVSCSSSPSSPHHPTHNDPLEAYSVKASPRSDSPGRNSSLWSTMSAADGEGPSLASLAPDDDVTMGGTANDTVDALALGISNAGAQDTEVAPLEDPLDATSSRDPDAAMEDALPSPSGPTPSRTSRRQSVLKTQPVAGPSTPTPAPKARTGRRSVTFLPDPEAASAMAVSPEKAAADEVLAWRSAQLDAKQAEVRFASFSRTSLAELMVGVCVARCDCRHAR